MVYYFMQEKKFLLILGLFVLALFLLGCTSQVPVCGDKVCSFLEENPNSQYFCPLDCGADVITGIEGKICKYDHECSRSGYCDNGVCAILNLNEVLENDLNEEVVAPTAPVTSSGSSTTVKTEVCKINSDCGKVYQKEALFCVDNLVQQKIITPTCNNLGKCIEVESEKTISTCLSTQQCILGKCVEKTTLASAASCSTKYDCLKTEDCVNNTCLKITCGEGFSIVDRECVCSSDTCVGYLAEEYLGEEDDLGIVEENNDLILMGAVVLVIVIIIGLVVFFILKKKKEQELEEAMEPNPDGFGNTI